MAATTPNATFIDPLREGKYAVRLGPALRDGQEPDRRYYSVRFNDKPRKPRNASRTVNLHLPSPASSFASPTLTITDRRNKDAASEQCEEEDRLEYNGAAVSSEKDTEPFALLYDAPSKSFTLHPFSARYGFNNKDDSGHGDATKSNSWAETTAKKQHNGLANGSVISATSSKAASPAHSATSEAAHTDVDADDVDPDNPFDWRHYVDNIPTTTGERAINGTSNTQRSDSRPPSATGTPLSKVGSPLVRANEPVATANSPPAPARTETPRSVPSSRPPASSGNERQLLKRPRKEPSVLRTGPPAKRPRNVSTSSVPGSQTRLETSPNHVMPSIQVERPTPTTTTNPTFSSRPHARSEPQPRRALADPNELIIEGEDDRPRGRQSGTPSYMTPPSGRPMSLREAASINASPMMPPRSGSSRSRFSGAGFATSKPPSRHGLGISGFDTGGNEVLDCGNTDEIDGGSARSNGDVETDIDIGSPAYAPKSPKAESGHAAKSPKLDASYTPQSPQLHAARSRSTEKGSSPEQPHLIAEAQVTDEQEEPQTAGTQDDADALEQALGEALEQASNADDAAEVPGADEDEDALGDALAEALTAAKEDDDDESEEE